MAFKMAEVMAEDKDVLMYLDIKAVHLVVKDAPDVEMEGFPSSLEQIGKLIEAGVATGLPYLPQGRRIHRGGPYGRYGACK